jgi:hypothetical protein
LITPRTIQDLVTHIRLHLEEEPEGVRAHLADMPAPDIKDLLNHLSLAEAATVLTLVPFQTAAVETASLAAAYMPAAACLDRTGCHQDRCPTEEQHAGE